MDKLSLDVDSPERVAEVLRAAAEAYRESAGELKAAWGDDSDETKTTSFAGQHWRPIAAALDRAARSCDNITAKRY